MRISPTFAILFLTLAAPAVGANDIPEDQLVPGFELEDPNMLVPGFGEDEETAVKVEVLDQDRRTADDRFRRYDTNRDNYLSREELSRNRWDDNPMRYDRNGDGRLSKSEMARRYAQKRVGRSQGEADRLMKFYVALDTNKNNILEPSEFAKHRSRSDIERRIRESGMDPARPVSLRVFMSKRLGKAGVSSDEAKRVVKSFGSSTRAETKLQTAEADRLMKFYVGLDRNRNRVLEPSEYARHSFRRSIEQKIREAGMDPSRPVPLSAFMKKRLTGEGLKSSQVKSMVRRIDSRRSSDKRRTSRKKSDRGRSDRQVYRIKPIHERLPSGLPDWFKDKDRNRDGQVQLSEYSTGWTDEKMSEFRGFDRNGDGVITAKECLEDGDESAE